MNKIFEIIIYIKAFLNYPKYRRNAITDESTRVIMSRKNYIGKVIEEFRNGIKRK